MSKLEFKDFVKRNTNLINIVEKGETTWQKLYELYDLYGENNSIWDKYLSNNTTTSNSSNNLNISSIGNNVKEIMNFVKGIDLNSVQKGLNGLDKAIEAFKDILPDKTKTPIDNYEPRPTYRYFED